MGRTPESPEEELLCGLFAEVLGVPQLGPDEDFFDLGVDSIVTIRLVLGARKAGLPLKARDVFEHQTVMQLATVLERRSG